MALAVILLLSRLILNASNAQTLPGWNVGCRADTVRVEQDSAFGFLCHWSRADVGRTFSRRHRPRGGPIIDGR